MESRPLDFDQVSVVTAIEQNLREWDADFGRLPPGKVIDSPHMLRFDAGFPFWMCNGVFQFRLHDGNLDHQIHETMAYFSERRLPMYWYVGPSTVPSDLGERLLAHGLVAGGKDVGMAMHLGQLPLNAEMPQELDIEEVSDEDALRDWIKVWVAGTSLPEWVVGDTTFLAICRRQCLQSDPRFRYYLGTVSGKPVATSMLFLGAGVAGLYSVATLDFARHQGIGTAMTLHAMHQGRNAGYTVGVLQALDQGVGVYLRLGFSRYCEFETYVWSDSPASYQS